MSWYKFYIWSDVVKCYRASRGLWFFGVPSNLLLILKQFYAMHQVVFFLPLTDNHDAHATGYSYKVIFLNAPRL